MRITNITLEMITVICFLIFICYESATMQKTVYKVPGIWSLRIKRIGRMKRFLKIKIWYLNFHFSLVFIDLEQGGLTISEFTDVRVK